ncbi:MAG: NACHT domain-containing protein [candidate division Zixibacteria bacterium]|nr:NACHT domain-containing protein [candidate division Zixibacteria bacterium]
MEEIEQIEAKPYLEKEIEDHNRFGKDRAKFFVGRTSILKTISEYLVGKNPHPLGIYGEGGSGKSALVAFALEQARREHPQAEIVFRFIGATLNSADGRALLEDLCRQISSIYGEEEALPTAFEELVEELPKRLALATADKPLILFLDSLDQLSAAHNARSLTWLPAELPENVRLIVTTRPGEYLIALRNKLPQDNIFELGPLSLEEGGILLDHWLKDAGRKLRDFQRKEVLNKFSACGWPLYLKLAFEEAHLWKSYTEEVRLSQDKKGIIKDNLFKRLEADHGEMLVSRCFGYMAASREMNGLAEDELLEILSLDTEFFDDFLRRAKHRPPEPKLPVAVWARLYFDLEPYLSGRSHEGAAILTFFHRELGDVARSKYLAEDEDKYQQVLADYFLSKADPEVEPKKKERKKTWQGTPRALSELPYHLTRAGRWDELFETLVDFRFLEQKAAKVGVVENIDSQGNKTRSYTGALALLEDYDLALNGFTKE